jgi:DHA1 family multidrug resistance protein-like MFS transporter
MRYAEEHESFIPVNLVPGGSNVEYEAPQRANEKPIQWYGPEDQENPRCWSKKKKVFVLTQIYIYSLTGTRARSLPTSLSTSTADNDDLVYMASAIYTPSAPYVAEKYGVNEGKAILGMSMYVLAYGTGALLFSPLSEIPRVGRNPPYIVTFFAFTLVSVGAAKVNSFEGLVALRFIMGFLGSPALATAGASIGDIATPTQLPYFMSLWAAFATSGPALVSTKDVYHYIVP